MYHEYSSSLMQGRKVARSVKISIAKEPETVTHASKLKTAST